MVTRAAMALTQATAQRLPRSRPARYPPGGAWPAECRADIAAAFLDYATTGELLQGVLRGEVPRPTGERVRNGRREPLWALAVLRRHVARRHEIAEDADATPAAHESVRELI